MDKFIEITGDVSPIHVSAEYAKEHGFTTRVCHGMLFGSMFSTLAGVYLPGEHCLLHSVETKFSLPVYPGDTLTVTGKISEINESFKVVQVKGTITNQNGKKVWTPYIWLFWQLPGDIHWALTKWKWFDRVKDDERYLQALAHAEEMKKQG